MAAFFDKMQRSARIGDDGSVPGYLRTHPMTGERIADAQNRAASLPYKQHLDNPDFQLVRAKLRADIGDARDAVAHFESALRDGRYASEAAARYGLANAQLRARHAKEADAEVARLRKGGGSGPMIETLAARVKQALGDKEAAAALLAQARTRYPYSRPLLYAQIGGMVDAGRNQEAAAQLVEAVRTYPNDPYLLVLQSKAYAALGKRLLQHQAQAEVYVLQGSLAAAIEQLSLARAAGDGDFYQLSVLDARLKDLRTQHTQEVKDNKR
jgi:predicted Zn-dependent protease